MLKIARHFEAEGKQIPSEGITAEDFDKVDKAITALFAKFLKNVKKIEPNINSDMVKEWKE